MSTDIIHSKMKKKLPGKWNWQKKNWTIGAISGKKIYLNGKNSLFKRQNLQTVIHKNTKTTSFQVQEWEMKSKSY